METTSNPSKKTLETLVQDIYEVLEKGNVKIDTTKLANVLAERLARATNEKPTLRMSNVGSRCERQLWYKINVPDKAEPLKVYVLLKFLMGDIAEELVLSLAEAAGHDVRERQSTVQVAGIDGHIDAVVDDVLVDVKSASSFSFNKFQRGLDDRSDSFGYLTQLSLYESATRDLADRPGEAAFVAVDKSSGHIHVDKHSFDPGRDWSSEVEAKKQMVGNPSPPPRGFHPEPEGASGNLKACVECSYCPFLKTCFPTTRTFLYSKGPVHLIRVEKEPNVPELIEGKIIDRNKEMQPLRKGPSFGPIRDKQKKK